MSFEWHDLVGNVGVAFIIVAYFLLQMNRLGSGSITFSLLNTLGAGLVLVSFIGAFNLSAFLLELFWVLISSWGLFVACRAQISSAKT